MSFLKKSQSSPRFREKHQKTYILPSLYGIIFASVCIMLLGIAFASGNNAVYFLCFILASLGSQSLVTTNKNIDLLKIEQSSAEDAFATEKSAVKFLVHNPTPTVLENILFEIEGTAPTTLVKLKPGERKEVLMFVPNPQPGLLKIPQLKVSSDFPYYFSRSWKKYYSEGMMYVYPARKGSPQFARLAFRSADIQAEALDDFKGHKEYQPQDSPRAIDWKVTARLDKVMVKEYDQEGSKKIKLRWQDCTQSLDEDKKSQLSLWIDLAEKNNFEYAVELPSSTLPFSRGPQHRNRCLRALL